jgi:sugar/nucleoside kinase (ribokinase family)
VGGVGYNVFRALGATPCRLVTAIGDGPFSRHAQPALDAFSPKILLRPMPGHDVGLYLAFMEQGRLLYGATDASTFETAMDEPFLDLALADVSPGDIVVADGNLLPGPLAHLIRALREREAWLVFETVSVDKSIRARSSLRDVFLATPTVSELAALIDLSDPSTAEVTGWMGERRIEHLVITLGNAGLRWVHGDRSVSLAPSRELDVADTTGAGDTLLGALLAGLHGWLDRTPKDLSDDELRQAVAVAMPDLLRDAMAAVEAYLIERAALRRDP